MYIMLRVSILLCGHIEVNGETATHLEKAVQPHECKTCPCSGDQRARAAPCMPKAIQSVRSGHMYRRSCYNPQARRKQPGNPGLMYGPPLHSVTAVYSARLNFGPRNSTTDVPLCDSPNFVRRTDGFVSDHIWKTVMQSAPAGSMTRHAPKAGVRATLWVSADMLVTPGKRKSNGGT